MADLIDPTQTGNYPVVLGEGILGKPSNDIFTGIRYNHKPRLSADSTRARLKPSLPGQTSSYDLAFSGKDGRTDYAFAGTRTVDGSQYVLYFDPGREAFVLDRIDSTFNMNITRTPNNSDPDSLAQKYPHLESGGSSGSGGGSKAQQEEASSSKKPDKAKPKQKAALAKSPPARKKDAPVRKPEQKTAAQPKNVNLALPPQPDQSKAKTKPKPKPKSRPADEEDEGEGEDDGLLLVEYPGGEPKSKSRDFSPAFPSVRRFDDFMDQRESEADDADGESMSEPDTDFKLPSPVNDSSGAAPAHQKPPPEPMEVDEPSDRGQEAGAGNPNLEDDLEKDLEEAFEAVANSQNGTPAEGDESEISEED